MVEAWTRQCRTEPSLRRMRISLRPDTEHEQAHEPLPEAGGVLPGEHVGDRHAHQLLAAVPGERAGRAVDLEVPPAGVRDEESDGRRGEVGAVELPALPQGLGRPQPLDGARHVAGQTRPGAARRPR